MARNKVFVSYSHKDTEWKDRLVKQLAALQRRGLLEVWVDSQIKGGEDWYRLIHEAMLEARVAVLLVSEHFLDSDFIQDVEVPRLMQSHAEDGMRIYPVIVWPCLWQFDEWLASKQVRPKGGAPLAKGSEYEIKDELVEIASEIFEIVKGNGSETPKAV